MKLTPEQQRLFIEKAPGVFNPCNGVWGQRGATNVHLATVKIGVLKAALETAFKDSVPQVKKKRRPVDENPVNVLITPPGTPTRPH